MSLLEVRDLKTHINLRTSTVKAVDGVTFDVGAGETVGIVGESGCGKTMTGMTIMRLLPNGGHIAGGSITLDGRDLASLSDAQMRTVRGNDIGMVFQDPMTSLNPTMPIGRQIAEGVALHRGVSDKQARARAAEVLDLVGMPRPSERLDDYPHQLSGGLRQRVMIAMALSCDPKLLIADEPTTALDVTIQAQILDLLASLQAELGMAMMLITHDMGVIAGRADRVVVMYAGRIVETAETKQLFSHTHHPYTEALLASIPQLRQDVTKRLYTIPGLPPDLTDPPAHCRFAARCAYAADRCREEDPPLGGPDPEHQYACFFPRDVSEDEIFRNADRIPIPAGAARSSAVAAHPDDGDLATDGVDTDDLDTDDLDTENLEADGGVAAAIEAARRTNGAGRREVSHEVVLDLREVSKEFNVTSGAVLQRRIGTLKAVSEVSLQVHRGETFGLVGESGCGKTTLGRMVVALETPTSGTVSFDGHDLASLGHRQLRTTRRDLQMMFQDPYASLDPRMRVGGIIEEPLSIQHRGNRQERARRVQELLAEVGLGRKAVDRYPHEFSGGQRQRIGLARALALNPKVIVADEPVSALDVSIRSQIMNLMKGLQETHDLTYIVISHDLSVVRYLADRVGVMYLGRLVEVGTGTDIYERTAHHYTAGLLGAIPEPNPEVEIQKRGAGIVGELPSPLHPPSGCRFRTRCPRAEDRCAAEVPPLRSFGGEHLAACHFPLQTPVEITTREAASIPS